MKIAVYTIAKNEEQFFDRWFESCKDADYTVILDTGSTDGTYKKAFLKSIQSNRCTITQEACIRPWRFDDARNVSLSMVPEDADICICLDMDEVLVPGWREKLEAAWQDGTDRLRYNYIWSWTEDGKPGLTYHADKIHRRDAFRWVNPVHEILRKDLRMGPEVQTFTNDTLIEHHPDTTKSRGQYLELLELSVKENPHDDRAVHYYARDLMTAGRYGEARTWFDHHTKMEEAKWDAERAASWRYMGDCNWALGNHALAIQNFKSAADTCPSVREPWISLAQAYRAEEEWVLVKVYCEKALAITERPNTYINSELAWSDWPSLMLQEAIDNLNAQR